MSISVPKGWRSPFRYDADQHSELKPISFTVVVRNSDRHEIGIAAQGSRGDEGVLVSGEPLVATKEADHAQVERSSTTRFPRAEPTPDRPQLFNFTEYRP